MFYPMAMNQTTPFRHARTNRNRVSRGSGISCCPSDFTHFSTAWLYRFDPLEAVGSACRPTRWLGGETVKHDPCRTALERVVKELEIWCNSWHPHAYHDPTISLRLIASNARAALDAAPAPVVGDDDLLGVFYDHCDYDDDASWIESEQFIVAARAVLAKYGTTPAPVPVPVSERLPAPEDCDAEGRCWWCGKVEHDWRLLKAASLGVPHPKYCFSHWLPVHALPLPEVTP